MRRQIALGVDKQPSAFERAGRAAHLLGCADCRRFESEVVAFTQMLRDAPLERLERPVVVRRAPRPAWKSLSLASPAAAAALVFAFVGLSGGNATRDGRSVARSGEVIPRVYPTAGEIEQEISFVEVAAKRSMAFTTNIR